MTPLFVDGLKASPYWRQVVVTLLAPLLLPMLAMAAIGGGPMRFLYPVYALGAGAWLYRRAPTLYPSFVLAVFAFAPFLRRLSDLDAGFSTLNWILVAPYAACAVSLLSLLAVIGRRDQPGALPLLLLTGCCVHAMFIALFQMRFLPVLYESLRWLMPVALAAFIVAQAGRAEPMRRETIRALVLIVIVVSCYGLYQYVALPAWDREWMLNVDNPTFGRAEPLQVRVFSTMNSPFSLAVFVSCALIVLSNERWAVSLPVAALAVPLLGLTLLRTAWIGLVIGIFVLFMLADGRRRLAIALGLLMVPLAAVALLESRTVPAEVNATIMERVESILNPRSDFSASERLMVYDAFMARLAESPWGEGYGANDSVLTKQGGRRSLVSIDSALLEIYLVHGVIVGSVYYAALLALLARGWQNLRHRGERWRGFFAVAIASLAILPLGANHIGEAGILFWLSLGFLAIAAPIGPPGRPDTRRSGDRRCATAALALALATALAGFGAATIGEARAATGPDRSMAPVRSTDLVSMTDLVPTADLTLTADATAEDFIDSLGVNVHWNYGDTAYGARFDEVRDRLLMLGIRHVRDFASPRMAELARLGIRTTLLTKPDAAGAAGVRDLVAAQNRDRPTIAAVEGANEPDLFWEPLGIRYRGAGFPEGPARWQRDLHAALKEDPRTASIPVIGPSLGKATSVDRPIVPAWDGLGRHADFSNFHPYPFNGNPFAPEVVPAGREGQVFRGNHPSVLIDARDAGRIAYADIYPGMPMVATEVGYPTGPGRTPEALQAKYVTRIFLENFRHGIARTYLYELLDAVAPTGDDDPHAGFGLLRADVSPRPAFDALRRLVAAVGDGDMAGRHCEGGRRLALRVEGTPAYPDPSRLHGLALRHAAGAMTVLLWHEMPGENAARRPPEPVGVDALPVRIRAACRIRPEVLDLTSGAQLVTRVEEQGRALRLQVADSPVVIRIGD